MKNLFALIAPLMLSVVAQAETQQLVSLTCVGSNGLKLEMNPSNGIVKTEFRGLKRDFQTNGSVTTYGTRKKLTRIVLSQLGATNVFLYDIFLSQAPKRAEKITLDGVIGKSVYSVVPTPIGAFVPVPVGFVPSTKLECQILTK